MDLRRREPGLLHSEAARCLVRWTLHWHCTRNRQGCGLLQAACGTALESSSSILDDGIFRTAKRATSERSRAARYTWLVARINSVR